MEALKNFTEEDFKTIIAALEVYPESSPTKIPAHEITEALMNPFRLREKAHALKAKRDLEIQDKVEQIRILQAKVYILKKEQFATNNTSSHDQKS